MVRGPRVVKVPEAGGVHAVDAVHRELIIEASLVALLHLLRERPELRVQVADVVLDHLQRDARQAHLLQRKLIDVRVRALNLLPRRVRRVHVIRARLSRARARHRQALLHALARLVAQRALPLVDVFDRVHHALQLHRQGGGDCSA